MQRLRNKEQLQKSNIFDQHKNEQQQQVYFQQPQDLTIIRQSQPEQHFIITFVGRSKLARCVFVTFILIAFVFLLNMINISFNIYQVLQKESPEINKNTINQTQVKLLEPNANTSTSTNISINASTNININDTQTIFPKKDEKNLDKDIKPLEFWKQSANDQPKPPLNSSYQSKPILNEYPKKIPNVSTTISEKDLSNIKQLLIQTNLTKTTIEIGRQYLRLGLSQPSEQLINRQKAYYEEKYALSKVQSELPLCVVILSFNNNQFQRYRLALNSVFRQEYQNYRVFYIDDASTDGTGQAVQAYIKQYAKRPEKFKVIHNKENKKAMENHYIAGKQYCKPEQIYFMAPDGDDCLIGTQVFKLYNYYFHTKDIWLAWGNYMLSSRGNIGGSRPMPQQTIQKRNYRNYQWTTSHPKAFYNKLWLEVKKEDLIDSQTGQFYRVAQDLGMMYPMIELAGRRIIYIPEITYLYVDNNSGSEMVLYLRDIRRVTQQVKNKKKYPELNCLFYTQSGSAQNCVQPKKFALNKI